jgi:hypothetical protein
MKAQAIAVETDMFEHREVRSHFINPCCFGEDFAAWLRQQFSPLQNVGFIFSEPIQEDYGWGLWATRKDDRFWIAISYEGDGPQEPPARWVISVTYDPGPNLIKRVFHKHDVRALEELERRVLEKLKANGAITIITPKI